MDCREISQEELDQIIQERDALRAQVATLSAGKAWIPEPTDEDWKESIRVSKVLAWAREHAVAPVVVPTMDWEEVNSRSRLNFEDDDTLSPVIYANGYAKGYSDLASLIRPIPTDRILQDGQVAVRELSSAEVLDAFYAWLSEWRPDCHYHTLDTSTLHAVFLGGMEAARKRAKKEGGQG